MNTCDAFECGNAATYRAHMIGTNVTVLLCGVHARNLPLPLTAMNAELHSIDGL